MAIEVSKQMLKREYSWQAEAGDDPTKIRHDARLFNRREGYEVAAMIQRVMAHLGRESTAEVERIEALIADELPGSLRGRERVFQWLVERPS